MDLLPDELRAKLLENGRLSAEARVNDASFDPEPVVKFFTPDGACTWLITEMDPEHHDTLFGLCDLGMGSPELGYVSFAEILEVRGNLGLPVERDEWFQPKHTVGTYASHARQTGHIGAS